MRRISERYSPPLEYVEQLFDAERIREVREAVPDRCLIYGTHIGPFTAGYMAMGMSRFFTRLVEDPTFVCRLLEARTEWCIAMYRKAVRLGAEVLILGDDAGHRGGPMISPGMSRQFMLPLHRRIVDALDAPVIWHSDGNIEALLPMAVEAGFAGVHGLDPMAGHGSGPGEAGVWPGLGPGRQCGYSRVVWIGPGSRSERGRSLHRTGGAGRRLHAGHLQQHL